MNYTTSQEFNVGGTMKVNLVFFSVFSFFSILSFAEDGIGTLADTRAKLKLPNYTGEEKQLLVEQAHLFLNELFVHRDIKIKDFGVGADPVPKLEVLKKDAAQLSSEDFHQRMSDIFSNLHDLHTNYIAPKPLSCAATFIPLRFDSVLDDKRDVVVVSAKLRIRAESVKDVRVGDELVAINGEPVEKILERLGKISGGANSDAMRIRAVEMLSLRSLATQQVPQEDELKFEFLREGNKIEVTVPWFAYRSLDCIGADSSSEEESKLSLRKQFNLSEDEFQKRYNKIFGSRSLLSKQRRWAAPSPLDEVFEMTTLNTPVGLVGYIQLKGFSWDNPNLDIATVVEGFRREIEGRLSRANGLVIDVRGNPGGYIVFAEKLVQLFSTKEVEPTKVQMLANKLNENIFLNANGQEDNRWSAAVRSALTQGSPTIQPMPITTTSEANSLGQIWFRPVIILTDAACFSACDLFAAGMQDNGAGVIIGVHKTTGAGGANVMEHSVFRQIMEGENNPFKALPHSQNMRVSWRQTVRSAKNQGQLIEDLGIRSDVIVPVRKSDIETESKDLMEAIHQIIHTLQPKYKSGLAVRRGNSVLLKNGEEAKWVESLYGVDKIELWIKGEKVHTVELCNRGDKTGFEEVTLEIPGLKKDWSDEPVTMVGYRNRNQVFRVVRELIWRGRYLEIGSDGLNINSKQDEVRSLFTVNLKGQAESGWQFVGNKLRVGRENNYENNILSRAFIPLDLKKQSGKLFLDISLKAENDHDSLRIYFNNPDTYERIHVFAGSNLSQQKGVSISLPEEWDRADMVFEFESDENWNMAGPEIENLKFIQ